MKIFVYSKDVFLNRTSNNYSSVVLVGDKDQIYYYSVDKNNNDKFISTINNIRKSLAFVRNNKPLYCNNNIEVFTNITEYRENLNIENRIFRDEYINMFKKERNQDINLLYKIKDNKDKEFINFARTLVNVEIRNDYAKNLINLREK